MKQTLPTLSKILQYICHISLVVMLLSSCQKPIPDSQVEDYAGSDQVLNVLKFLKANPADFKEIAPHFPNPTDWVNGTSTTNYSDSFKKWTEEHFNEFQAFANSESIRSKGFAWQSLGFENPYIKKVYHSPFSQAAQVFTEARLQEVAPHFPKQDGIENQEAYEQLLKKWQTEYPQEYENWLNAPEIIAIKPEGSKELVDLGIQAELPEFMSYPDIDLAYPMHDPAEETEHEFAMRLQHWYFIYNPEKYEEKYGKFPVLPDDFDLDNYISQYPKE